MTQDSKIAAERESAKAEQERSRNRRAEQAEAIKNRSKLEDSLNDSAKTLLASAGAERQEEGLRVIRDGLAEDVENLILEIRRDVDIARKQKRLSQKADRLAQNVMTFASAFAGRKRMLEEVETKLGLLRKVTAEGAEHAGGKRALGDLPEGCKDLKKQIAELTQALTQQYSELSHAQRVDHRRELSLLETFEECLEHLEPRERGHTEVQVRKQLKELEYDKRIAALDKVVRGLIAAIPPMRERIVERTVLDAEESFSEGDTEAALELIAEAKTYVPDHRNALRLEASCHERLEGWPQAVTIRTQLFGHPEAEATDALALMATLERTGNTVTALKTAGQAAERWPEHREVLQRWGDIAWSLGAWRPAAEAYSQALKLLPDDLRLLRRHGCALVEDGCHEEGLDILRVAVRKKDGNGHIHRYLGRAYQGLNQMALAVSEFEKAIEMVPAESKNFLGYARVLVERGLFSEAVDAAHKALELAGDDRIPGTEALGTTLFRSGRMEETRTALREHVESGQASPEAVYTYASASWKLGQLQEAEAALLPALKKSPDHTDLRHTYGLICIETGRMDQAMKYMAPPKSEARAG